MGGAEGATAVIPGQGGAGARVAVLDTGIDCGHEDLAGGCIYGENFMTQLRASHSTITGMARTWPASSARGRTVWA